MKAQDVVKQLKELGWKFSEGKKHTKGIGPDGRVTWIPRHKGDIPVGTLAEIQKQTGVRFK